LAPVTRRSVSDFVIPLLLLLTGLTPAEQLPIKTYTTAEGLAHNHINRIRQDSRGYLWFCTDGGLSRFDGYQFTNYTTEDGLPHSWVNDLVETRDGTYWIATDGGVCRFNPKGSRIKQSREDSPAALAEPMFVVYRPSSQNDASRVNALAEDASGAIWCATYAGLYRFQQSEGKVAFEFVDIGLPRNAYEGGLVNNLAFDRHGTLWIAARHGLFRRFPDGRAERYTAADGLPEDFTETVFQDQHGGWWVGTRVGGFCSVAADPKPSRRVVERCYSTADGLAANEVRSIFQSSFQSSTGRLWIGTTGGLSEFDPSGPRFRNYTSANGLSTAVIYKLGEDRNGNLWIGTRDGGLMKMADNGFVTYSAQDGFVTGNADASIFECLNGRVCVITAVNGRTFVERFDGNRFIGTEISLPVSNGLSTVWLRPGSFQDASGEWWVATIGGLYRLPKATRVGDLRGMQPRLIYDVTHGSLGPSLNYIYRDTRGDIWMAMGSYGGTENHLAYDLARWERTTGMLRHLSIPDRVLQSHVRAMTALGEDASGNLWIGFDQGGGLVRYRARRFEPFQQGEKAFEGEIRAIFLDHVGRLWVASTQAGLSRIDNPTSDRPQLTRYTLKQGLSSNEIRCITEDRFGRIYVGTNRGVDRLDPTAANAIGLESSRVRHYTWVDGLAKGTVQFAFRDRGGTLWFLTNDGISRLVPAPDPAPVPGPILITGLKIGGVPKPLSQLGETEPAHLNLPPSRNEVEIEFLSLDFRENADLQYQYTLDGTDGHWSTPSNQRRVLYPNLTPGKYRFLVRAVASDGSASSTPAVADFNILAPFWKRWWFIALEAAVAALAIYGLYRYRLQQLLAIERMRTRIATDLHDDIGSSLSQIAILSEVARRESEDAIPRAAKPLSEIAVVSGELVDALSDIVWAINPKHDHLSNLEHRMRRFATDVLTARNINLEFQATGIQPDLRIGADVRRQLFLIFKEAVNNIARHSGASLAEVEVSVAQEQLVLQVTDNGIGFDPGVNADGNGLANMRKRASDLGGTAVFKSLADQGTTFTLRMPLTYHCWWGRKSRN
jgi:ligand-binding sensor domain-containing protein/signal transduction histidine kinase